MTTHLHVTTWVLALVLFIVALVLHKGGKQKAAKIVQMILRVLYILIIVTGIQLFLNISPSTNYHIKMLMGILVIGALEMVLIRTIKGKATTAFWALLIIFLGITIYLGLILPLGWIII